jgi:hypothetical protein
MSPHLQSILYTVRLHCRTFVYWATREKICVNKRIKQTFLFLFPQVIPPPLGQPKLPPLGHVKPAFTCGPESRRNSNLSRERSPVKSFIQCVIIRSIYAKIFNYVLQIHVWIFSRLWFLPIPRGLPWFRQFSRRLDLSWELRDFNRQWSDSPPFPIPPR